MICIHLLFDNCYNFPSIIFCSIKKKLASNFSICLSPYSQHARCIMGTKVSRPSLTKWVTVFSMCSLLPIWKVELKINKKSAKMKLFYSQSLCLVFISSCLLSQRPKLFLKNSRKGQRMMKHSEEGASQAEDVQNNGLKWQEDMDGPGQAEASPASHLNHKSRGGYTCCVPLCYNNSKQENLLKFHRFPNRSSQETIELCMKWISIISRKDFTPNKN